MILSIVWLKIMATSILSHQILLLQSSWSLFFLCLMFFVFFLSASLTQPCVTWTSNLWALSRGDKEAREHAILASWPVLLLRRRRLQGALLLHACRRFGVCLDPVVLVGRHRSWKWELRSSRLSGGVDGRHLILLLCNRWASTRVCKLSAQQPKFSPCDRRKNSFF